jgi:hypothetical protein
MGSGSDATPHIHPLEEARKQVGLGRLEIWVRYFSLGGAASPLELDAYLNDSLTFVAVERDILVQVLNERFTELGISSPLDATGQL